MGMLNLDEILNAVDGRVIEGGDKAEIAGISTDSRTIKRGELFIAIKGDDYDGHDFVDDALAKGAVGAVVSHDSRFTIHDSRKIIIRVKNTRRALGDIARLYRKRFEIPLVAITGSTGKTTAKEMLFDILSLRYNVLRNEGTENNIIGVSRAIMGLNAGHDACLVELGTNHFGEIRRLSEVSSPTSAILTNIGPSHLEFLKDEEGVFKAKLELLENMEPAAKLFVNSDDRYLSRIDDKRFRIVRFGIREPADFRAGAISLDWNGTSFLLNERHRFTLSGLGIANVYNALAAITCARDMGIAWEDIRRGLARFRPVPMRMEVLKLNGLKIINDSYNANPLSMRNAIDTLSALDAPSRKVLILADMLELGEGSIGLHREIGNLIGCSGIDILITIGGLAEHIALGATGAGMDAASIYSFRNKKGLIDNMADILKKDDTVLMKGSRLMKLEDILECFITSYTL